MTTPGKPSGTLLEQALQQLPENELNAKATSTDGKTADVKVSIQKTWMEWGLGLFGFGKLGAGRPKDMGVGIEVKKKL